MATTTVTARDIQELRQRTGAGMMDCKRALEETGGDMEKAIELLRKKGIAKADKRAGRAAAEGRIVAVVAPDARSAALIELNSETDFVARNEAFGDVANAVAAQVLSDTSNDGVTRAAAEGALMKQPWQGDRAKTVEEAIKEASGRTGENVVLRRYARFTTDGVIGSYVHHTGKLGVLVEVAGGAGDAVRQLADAVAQHVAAGVPKVALGVDRGDIPTDLVERERRIFEEQARTSGKPENIIGKIVDGQIKKFYEENTLLDQVWVRDEAGKLTIRQLVANAAKEAGAALSVRRFARFQMGEE